MISALQIAAVHPVHLQARPAHHPVRRQAVTELVVNVNQLVAPEVVQWNGIQMQKNWKMLPSLEKEDVALRKTVTVTRNHVPQSIVVIGLVQDTDPDLHLRKGSVVKDPRLHGPLASTLDDWQEMSRKSTSLKFSLVTAKSKMWNSQSIECIIRLDVAMLTSSTFRPTTLKTQWNIWTEGKLTDRKLQQALFCHPSREDLHVVHQSATDNQCVAGDLRQDTEEDLPLDAVQDADALLAHHVDVIAATVQAVHIKEPKKI